MKAYISAVAAFLTILPAAGAQTAAAERTSDEQALAQYRLSMPAIHKLLAATRAMARVIEDPATKEAAAKFSKSRDAADGYRGLDDIARDIEKFPPMAAAIRSAGITPREYMLVTMSYMQAGMAAAFKKQGLLKELPKGTPAENVAFLEKNEPELQSLQKEFNQLQQRMKPADKTEEPEAEDEPEDESPAEEEKPQPRTKK
jgi:hypothetical protein